MSDIGWAALSLAGGLGLGAFFFGGLWWTVRRLPTFERPALMAIGSLLLRTGVTLGGFLVLASGHWQRLLACLAGFALARLVARLALRAEPPSTAAQVASRGEGAA